MNGTLPVWLQHLLGIDAGPGEGTVWSLEYRWHWPPSVTLAFAVFAVFFLVAIYLREGRTASRAYRISLAVIRLALVGVVLMMIAQVSLSLKRTGLPYVAVLLDDSESMTIVDRYEDELRAKIDEHLGQTAPDRFSRWNLARTLLTENDAALTRGLARDYKLRAYLLSDSPSGARSATAGAADELLAEIQAIEQPSVASTRLGAAVRTVLEDLRGTAPAAIVLLTDGINTDGPSLAEAAALAGRKGVPLFAIGLGSDEPVRDLKLADLQVDPLVFVDDVVHFALKLVGTGFEGKKVRVVLREEDQTEVLAEVEVTVGPDGQPQQVQLPYRPTKVGEFRYVVEVEPLEGELQTDNNRQTRDVEVRKEKIRVLLVQGYPSFEFRYLRQMLGRDETIELATVLQEADVEYAEQDKAALPVFPVRRDELFAYDVIILGDADPKLLSATMMQNLVDFVDQPGKGGALVFIAGERYMPLAYRGTPLARLFPVDTGSVRFPDPSQPITEGFSAQPTELGLASPPLQLGDTMAETRDIWQNLAPLYWLMEAPQVRPLARTLLEHPTRRGHDGKPLPVVLMQYVGAGKVVMHCTDETWRWRRRVGDVFFARYWVQLLRYLARSKLADAGRPAVLEVDRREYNQGESVRLRLRFVDERLAPPEDDGVTVVLEHQGHKTRRLKLRRSSVGRGSFEGVVSQPAAGNYHAWVAVPALEGRAPTCDFTVKPPAGEFETVRMDSAALKHAAKQTGGRYYTFATADGLLEDLPPGRQVPIESLPPKPLWNKWPVLALFLLLLIGEWILRKVGGMV